MHGLIDKQELQDKVASVKTEFGVQVGHSVANVRSSQEIRHVCVRSPPPNLPWLKILTTVVVLSAKCDSGTWSGGCRMNLASWISW